MSTKGSYDGCYIKVGTTSPSSRAAGFTLVFLESVLFIFIVLFVVCFLFVSPVSCVPNVVCVSGLLIFDCPFDFHYGLFTQHVFTL